MTKFGFFYLNTKSSIRAGLANCKNEQDKRDFKAELLGELNDVLEIVGEQNNLINREIPG